jgi:aspartyl/asparaginyl-tRNA synthetase
MFRSYLDSQGFIEVHTPKLQGSATESGASVFEVNYFGRPVYLAQVCYLTLLKKYGCF